MNEIAKTGNGTQVTNVALPNFYEAYGNSVSNRNIVGSLLKFSKGDYLAGEAGEEVPIGTKLVVNMDSLSIGWIKWQDNKPVEQDMGPVMEGYRPRKRTELGDTDEEQWEEDTQGQKRDPWQFSNYILMRPVGRPDADETEMYTFATSSRGGLNAIGELCKVYGKNMREKPDDFPVVALQVNSYVHPNKEFGRIKVPVLEVVGWESKKAAPKAAKKAPAKKR